MVRKARLTDVPALVDLTAEAFLNSRYPEFSRTSPEALDRTWRQLTGDPTSAYVAVSDDVTAVLAVSCMPLYYCVDIPVITDIIWYVSEAGNPRDGLRLLNHVTNWVDSTFEGRALFRMTPHDAIVDPDKVAPILEARGFRRAGFIYEKEMLT